MFVYLIITNNIKESRQFEKRMEERKAAEEFSKNALREKDILLAEIHHRVKNNLAIISSLLNLQVGTTGNEEARNILKDSKNRVKSMSLIHDSLYKSKNLSEIDFAEYTNKLIDEINASYPTLTKNITVKKRVSPVIMNVVNAIPCGLILNELFTNCYKHAFVGRDKGTIDLTISEDIEEDMVYIKIKDDGVGLHENYDKKDSLGLIVIQSLCEQLDAKYSFTSDHGTRFEMRFKKSESDEKELKERWN
jgi:two-component sensor histidine kinase